MTPIQQKLAAIFQGEHAEHLQHIRSILALIETVGETKGRTELDEAFRRAHSLKGAARAVELGAVEGLATGLETLFSRVREGTLVLDPQVTRVIHQVLDASEDCVAAFRESRIPNQPDAALHAIGDLLGMQEVGIPELAIPEAPGVRKQYRPAVSPALPSAPAFRPAEMVRLPGENLDRLVRTTGQILAETQRQKTVTRDLGDLNRQIDAMAAECVRFRIAATARLRRPAGTPEFSSVTDHIGFVEQTVRGLAAQSRAARLLQQRSAWSMQRAAEQLQRDVWSARMAPAEDLFEGFGKMVRDLARDENKEIDFRLSGSGVRADRMVLQALKDPVMHLLRNAISHGIETPGERVSKGKSAAGSLILRLDSQRGRLVVEVDDDGRGVDLKRVACVLSQAGPGTLSPDELAGPPEDLARVIFRPGFSTSPTVNDLSGRGMGLSVVYEAARRLQGDVELKQKEGPGAAFLLSVPLSVSTCHLLLISSEGQTFGIPTHGIERLYRIQPEQVETVEGKPVVKLEGQPIGLYSLSYLLGIGETSAAFPEGILSVVVLRSGARRVAICVDELVGERDALIQELGMACPANGNVSGGALLREGAVFVVLNTAGLVANSTHLTAAPVLRRAPAPAAAIAPSILVVDDSITARSLEKSILTAHGYRVRVAVDGIHALEMLRLEPADLIITDVQMPRLDGFGLLEALKADSRLKGIPVIIVSSLERAEDQERGLLLGADAYVVKRKFDQTELLDAIRQMI